MLVAVQHTISGISHNDCACILAEIHYNSLCIQTDSKFSDFFMLSQTGIHVHFMSVFLLIQVVCKLLSLFSDEDYSQLMEWIYKFSRNTKISYRVFALDLLSELFTVPQRTPPEGTGYRVHTNAVG